MIPVLPKSVAELEEYAAALEELEQAALIAREKASIAKQKAIGVPNVTEVEEVALIEKVFWQMANKTTLLELRIQSYIDAVTDHQLESQSQSQP